MEQVITQLSPEQAQRALMIFYDLLPGDFWEGGVKPSVAKLEATAEQLQEDAPDDVRPVVEAMLAEGSEEEKGEAAKAVLGMFYEQEELRGYVEQATEQAQQPHMAPIPLIIGAVIIFLGAVPKEIKWKGGGIKWDVAGLMNGLANFVGKLPAKFLEQITQRR
jgi:hypothetical protein